MTNIDTFKDTISKLPDDERNVLLEALNRGLASMHEEAANKGNTEAAQPTNNQVDQGNTIQTMTDDDLAAQLRELQKQPFSKTKDKRDEILAEMESRDPKTHGVVFSG